MILHKDIEQKTEAWFNIKHGKIGGSTSKSLLVKGDTLLLEMLAARCEDFAMDQDSFESKDMQRGNELEPIAIRELQTYTGVEFKDIGWVEHSTIKILGISPDGLSLNNKIACEVKCPSAKKHIEYIKGKCIPLEYVNQCIHYFTVIDSLNSLHFASFRPENKFKPLFVHTITRDSMVDIGLVREIEVEVLGKKGTPIKPKIVKEKYSVTISEAIIIIEEKAIELEAELLTELENIKF